jgi:hypothetical protein
VTETDTVCRRPKPTLTKRMTTPCCVVAVPYNTQRIEARIVERELESHINLLTERGKATKQPTTDHIIYHTIPYHIISYHTIHPTQHTSLFLVNESDEPSIMVLAVRRDECTVDSVVSACISTSVIRLWGLLG